MDFNHWDIILFIPLVYAAWKGFMKGVIIEASSIAGLIAGVYVAANFSQITASKLNEWFDIDGQWIGYLAFLVTFVGVLFGVYFLAKLLEKAVNLVALGVVNKVAGLLFGVLKMALILSIVLQLLGWVNKHLPVLSKTEPEKSMLFSVVQPFAPDVLPILTESDWSVPIQELLVPDEIEE